MGFKDSEKKYWDLYYAGQEINYSAGRDLNYHDAFKGIMKTLPAGSTVLELACGLRCDGIEIAKSGQNIYETDISEVAVGKAKELYNCLGLAQNAEFIRSDAENLPFDENYFDAVFISASFHHLPNPQKALLEMKRVVKHGGYVILGLEPNSWPYYTLFLIMKPLKRLLRKIHHQTFSSMADDLTHGFTKNKLTKMLNAADLVIVSIGRFKYLSEFYDSGWRLFSKLFKKDFKPSRNIQMALSKIDFIIAKISIINLFNWHFSAIAKKK